MNIPIHILYMTNYLKTGFEYLHLLILEYLYKWSRAVPLAFRRCDTSMLLVPLHDPVASSRSCPFANDQYMKK